jgi:hypothetical protein
MTGQILLAWLKLLALDGDLARAEPKWHRVNALRKPPGQRQVVPAIQERDPRGPWNPGHLARQPDHRHTPALNSAPERGPDTAVRQPSTPMKDQG